MSTVIALEGRPRKGKTTTIGILFQLMKQNGYDVLQDKKRPNSHDFFVILKKGGKIIGVSSYGDSIRIIRDKLDYFIKKGCEIIVTASRNHGPIKNFIDMYPALSKTNVPKTEKPSRAEQLEANTKDAKRIFNEIESLLN